MFIFLTPVAYVLNMRLLHGETLHLGMPSISETQMQFLLPIGLIALFAVVLVVPMTMAGKSPHVRVRRRARST